MTRYLGLLISLVSAAGVWFLVFVLWNPTPEGQVTPPADLVLKNGKIVTLDSSRPAAQALAVRGDRIVLVGSNDEIAGLEDQRTEILDLGGRLTLPGFIEGHAHFTGIGEARLNLRLAGARSWDDVVATVARAAAHARPGEWIVGRGWHQEKWEQPPVPDVEGFPIHASLSRISPDNPVILTHASGHAAFVNAKAMAVSGITSATPNPPGGEILKDAKGQPTGLLRERAAALVHASGAGGDGASRAATIRRFAELADEQCLSSGITSFQDAGSSFEEIDVFKQMAAERRLGVRLWVMVRENNQQLAEKLASYRMVGAGNNHLTVRAIKVSLDGALGSRGAWLLEPYADLPSSTGLNTVPLQSLAETARLSLQHDVQLCVHAIGDRANREALNAFERAFGIASQGHLLRWRIEHAQHLHPEDIPRFGRLGVIASMQGIHATSDAPFVVERLGEQRARSGAYVWRKLIDSGAVVSNGTDAPVEDVSPIANYYASVTRLGSDGQVFYGDQRMTRLEALESYTLDAAYAAFEESIKGSLEPGKLADITVLSRDILTVPDEEIPGTEVVYTIVDGKVRYRGSSISAAR